MADVIRIRGAREHNLRIDRLELPRERLTVVTGVSGSGKSSLAFDTIYREGERRFLQTLSARARRSLGPGHEPRVASIEGLSPAVAVDAPRARAGRRSTVGTITGIRDALRLLFARLGEAHCPDCGRRIEAVPPGRIADRVLLRHGGRRVWITAPVVRGRRGSFGDLLSRLREQGFARVRIDGRVVRLGEPIALAPDRAHAIEVICDRLAVEPGRRSRLEEAVETAVALADGLVGIVDGERESLWSARFACAGCGRRVPPPEPPLFSFNTPAGACPECRGLGTDRAGDACPACGGRRLRPEALAVRLCDRTIAEIAALPVGEAGRFFAALPLSGEARAIGGDIVAEIRAHLGFLDDVGLGYLSLDRTAGSLAGGEAQRVRLAAQLGSELRGVLYVLDEPSVGLHPRDHARLLRALRRLRDRGNTVIVVEHDRDWIEAADAIVELGPGAGREGGRVIAEGTAEAIAADPASIVGRYLRGEATVADPRDRRRPGRRWLEIRGARHRNLRGIDVRIPLERLVAVTGVSGSGKSSLVAETILPAVARALGARRGRPGAHDALLGADLLDGVVAIDQAPIGRTPRSNAATYTRVFDPIRALFAARPESRARGYGRERFSFNRPGGRCEDCEGAGIVRVDLGFLAGVEVPCETCRGRRYNRETLEIRYRGETIAGVLSLRVAEALRLFEDRPEIARTLAVLEAVGLGYLPLGQPATALSAGEAQRVKLAGELARPARGRTLYLLDEPTTGLAFDDVGRLLRALRALVDRGGTVIVVEHHPELVAASDHVIDLGPGAGPEGGRIVAEGPPEAIERARGSHTGRALARRRKGRVDRAAVPRHAAGPVRAARAITVRGARTHNLRSVDVAIPWNRLTAVTGPSGAGKTSLVFDTIHAEGRRRYLEALAAPARRRLGRVARPPADRIDGVAPSIAVAPAAAAPGPRATVATTSEIHDLLGLLYARLGEVRCPACGAALRAHAPSRAAEAAIARLEGEVGYVLAPLEGIEATGAAPPRREAERLADWLLAQGFTRLLVGGRECRLEDGAPPLGRDPEEYLVVDRVRFDRPARDRIAASFEEAYRRAGGRAGACAVGGPAERYARLPACPRCGFGLAEPLGPRHFRFTSPHGACPRCGGTGLAEGGDPDAGPCPACEGERIGPVARAVRLGGRRLAEILALAVEAAAAALPGLAPGGPRARIAAPVLAELRARLGFLLDVGLGYLTLQRRMATLSAGEAQRVRLAARLGGALSGALYVLDEPSLGLHPRDVDRLVRSLRALRDRGNTVIVVEQDAGLLRAADHLIELGPGGGSRGGEVVAQGPPARIARSRRASVAPLLAGTPPAPPPRSVGPGRGAIVLRGARRHNLEGIDAAFPRGRLTVVAGVSGSGKSTLVEEVLVPAVRAAIGGARAAPGCDAIEGTAGIRRVVVADASPIGRTPASVPASSCGILGPMRAFFARLPEARRKGFAAGRFSFNRPAGRCPACRGRGHRRVELPPADDVWVPCEVCRAKRYNRQSLTVRYRGRTIADVLASTVREARELWRDHPRIAPVLELLERVGLGHLALGQPANTLSSGEAQRLRLARALGRPRRGEALYVLDEPTAGLAWGEVEALVGVLRERAERGDTVVVIEHDVQVILRADWVIELGPEGGEGGGEVLYAGPPGGLAACPRSRTGPYLRGESSPPPASP